ncbi:MAG TPA: amidohydrolase [Labilithrix sp.]|nr:amidohydrolase [Labilithrix sp.]
MLPSELSKIIDETIDGERASLTKLALDIHANPELRFQEHKAAAWIAELLRARGFTVEQGIANMPTALRATKGTSNGPRIAILGEYDALPEIGHACGHNLIAAGAVGAFLAAAAAASRVNGEVVFLGTPAEEGGGGKLKMIEDGVFDKIEAAMMFHPFDRDILAHPALANVWLAVTFRGHSAHAAAAPHEGRSALVACMDTFRLVDGQRIRFRDGVRVHGYITNGGQAVNVIPELASAEFSIRARDELELERVRGIVERCAKAAAFASEVDVDVVVRRGYRDIRNNMTMARAFGEHLRALGRTARQTDDRVGAGSTDMGDVSHVVPSIHPYLAIVDENTSLCHQHAFAAAAAAERGLDTAMTAARALARTAVELLADDGLRLAARTEWESARV